jgi:hypothetical protein
MTCSKSIQSFAGQGDGTGGKGKKQARWMLGIGKMAWQTHHHGFYEAARMIRREAESSAEENITNFFHAAETLSWRAEFIAEEDLERRFNFRRKHLSDCQLVTLSLTGQKRRSLCYDRPCNLALILFHERMLGGEHARLPFQWCVH